MLASSGSTTGTCGRSPSTPSARSGYVRSSRTTGSWSRSPGVRDAATIAAWRASGFDAALVGEALVRSADPAAAARVFVAAGRIPDDPANRARARSRSAASPTPRGSSPRSVRAPTRSGSTSCRDAARALAPGGDGPRPRRPSLLGQPPRSSRSPPTPGASGSPRSSRPLDPDAVQFSGDESADDVAAAGRPVWKALRSRARDRRRPAPRSSSRGPRLPRGGRRRGSCSTRRADRTRAAREPGSTNPRRRGRPRGADRPRRRPRPGQRRRRPPRRPGGRRRQRLRHRAAARPGRAPPKDPLRVALYVKRARAARDDRPNMPPRPTPRTPLSSSPTTVALGDRSPVRRPIRPGDPDSGARAARGRLRGGPPGSRLLVGAPRAPGPLRRPPDAALPRRPPRLRGPRAGRRRRPAGAACPAGLRLHLKREDLAHTGAHKINNALGQALLTRRLGKTRVIAETGAGQHGVATATACALLDLPCVVFMGAVDIERQQPTSSACRRWGRRSARSRAARRR